MKPISNFNLYNEFLNRCPGETVDLNDDLDDIPIRVKVLYVVINLRLITKD